MITVIAGKQSTCPNEKQMDSRRVSNLVLTAHAGTFIRPSQRIHVDWQNNPQVASENTVMKAHYA
jgi:hypothetical protein